MRSIRLPSACARFARAEVALLAQTLLALGLVLTCFLVGSRPALADVVSREGVTLGRLANDTDVIALGRVTAVGPQEVILRVEVALKRARQPALRLPPGRVRWKVGQRRLVFLRRAPRSHTLLRPASELHVIPADDDRTAAELVEATRGRLPRIGGDPARLRRELFAQLGSRVARIRQDAALDLLEHRDLRPTPAQRALLRDALARHHEEELLRLAARIPEPALLTPVLSAARLGDPRPAAEALNAIDAGAAARRLGVDLRGTDPARSVAAARTLGHLPGAEALTQLGAGLASDRDAVRSATIRALALRADLTSGHVAALEELVWRPRGGRDAELALAALSLAAPGQVLERLARTLPDPDLRRLAAALRREPIAGARRVLGRRP